MFITDITFPLLVLKIKIADNIIEIKFGESSFYKRKLCLDLDVIVYL